MAFGFNSPPAYMGFVGFVRILGSTITGDETANPGSAFSHGAYLIRATTASVNVTQDISAPNVIDSRYDRTVYQLGPKLVDGTVEFPAFYDIPQQETKSVFEALYRYAVTRRSLTGLLNDFNMEVKYATSTGTNSSEFLYKNCIVNTWRFAVTQSDVVTCSVSIIGLTRENSGILNPPARKDDGACTYLGNTTYGEIGNTRIVTWNDARVELSNDLWGDIIGGQYIRTFEANINNDAERFYTLNKNLFAQSIAPRKRDVNGSLVLMGRHQVLGEHAFTNEARCSESSELKFGFVPSLSDSSCENVGFAVTLPNVVFEIETMALTNDLFETTVNWRSLPASGTGVCDPLITSISTNPASVFTY